MSWTAVGLGIDLPAGCVMPACVSGTELAIWRSQSGAVHAWGDRCPHRGMRLSHGFVRGDQLACIYHGWHYDTDGACAQIPAHPDLTPPKTICAETFACRDVDGVLWVSLTATDAAVPSLAHQNPIRSMPIDCPAQAVAAEFGNQTGHIIQTDTLTLALQPVSPTSCMIHALAAPTVDAKDVSRRLEALRTTLERAAA